MPECRCAIKYDAMFTEAELRELLANDGRLEGYWKLTIFTPVGSSPFTRDNAWLDLITAVAENAGANITGLQFVGQTHTESFEYGFREE